MGYSAYVDMPFHATSIILLKMLLFYDKNRFWELFLFKSSHETFLKIIITCTCTWCALWFFCGGFDTVGVCGSFLLLNCM